MKNERQPILERERRAEPALWMETVQTTVLCAAFSGTAETPSQIFASGRTNKCLAGLERTSRMTSSFFFFFFTLFFVIPVATIRDKNLKQPPSKHSMNKHCQPEKNKNPDRFILCYISILHHFLLTCSERSRSHQSTLCFDGEMDLSRQCGGEDTLLEISHL